MQVAIMQVAVMTVRYFLCLYVGACLLITHEGGRLYGHH